MRKQAINDSSVAEGLALSLFHYGVGRHRSTELAVTHSTDAMRKQPQTEI